MEAKVDVSETKISLSWRPKEEGPADAAGEKKAGGGAIALRRRGLSSRVTTLSIRPVCCCSASSRALRKKLSVLRTVTALLRRREGDLRDPVEELLARPALYA